jgi:hypothetical protein
MRVKLFGDLAGARIPLQADIGFGDAVTPKPRSIEYPTEVVPLVWTAKPISISGFQPLV